MHVCFHTTASVLPSKVMDLEVSVDSLEPSVTLKWSSPTDWIAKKCLNEYQIYFNGHILSVQSTTCNLSRDQGLVPLQSTAFNVRAVSQCVAGEWCTVNAFIGKLIRICYRLIVITFKAYSIEFSESVAMATNNPLHHWSLAIMQKWPKFYKSVNTFGARLSKPHIDAANVVRIC